MVAPSQERMPAADPTIAPPGPDDAVHRGTGHLRLLTAGAVVVTLVPLVVAVVTALRRGWLPVGDTAIVSIRAHDVLGGRELPLVGMVDPVSRPAGVAVSQPGPLLYDLLAMPAALVPGPAGVLVGAALINGLAVAGTALVAWRRGGVRVALAAAAYAAALLWAMGSAVLVEPWPPNMAVLPMLLYLVTCWAVAAGDAPLLPLAAAVGSFVVQTDPGYAVLVVGVLVCALGLAAAQRSTGVRWRSPLVAAAVVAALCWAQPLIDELRSPGEGNISRLWEAAAAGVPTLSWRAAVPAVARVVTLPPWFARPSYERAFVRTPFGNVLPPLALALAGLAVFLLSIAGRRVRAGRRGDRSARAALDLAALVMLLATVSALVTPASPAWGAAVADLRWLWPVSVFVGVAQLANLLRNTTAHRMRPASVACLGIVLVGATLLNLAWHDAGSAASPATRDAARVLVAQATAAREITGRVLVDCRGASGDPYCGAVLAGLVDDGVQVVVRDPLLVRQLGEQRRWDGRNAGAVVTVASGDRTRDVLPGGTVVARHDGLDAAEQAELARLRSALRGAFAAGEVRLNDRGRAVAARGDLVSVPDAAAPIDPVLATRLRPTSLAAYRREMVLLVEEDLLDADPAWRRSLDLYADLQDRWDRETATVVVQPVASVQDAAATYGGPR
ncbi:MAG TPA: hypothetical protein VFI47_29175 [Acidimicrobiales bacterium]|nr:hypothetical protein [Acidimicrobiales bacterium]